jgi:hypothetical protein
VSPGHRRAWSVTHCVTRPAARESAARASDKACRSASLDIAFFLVFSQQKKKKKKKKKKNRGLIVV